ncbi:hypothetical protein ACTXT7_014016 [Hymenolepis weldensis]
MFGTKKISTVRSKVSLTKKKAYLKSSLNCVKFNKRQMSLYADIGFRPFVKYRTNSSDSEKKN